jgi:hypothetical protein
MRMPDYFTNQRRGAEAHALLCMLYSAKPNVFVPEGYGRLPKPLAIGIDLQLISEYPFVDHELWPIILSYYCQRADYYASFLTAIPMRINLDGLEVEKAWQGHVKMAKQKLWEINYPFIGVELTNATPRTLTHYIIDRRNFVQAMGTSKSEVRRLMARRDFNGRLWWVKRTVEHGVKL